MQQELPENHSKDPPNRIRREGIRGIQEILRTVQEQDAQNS